MTSLSVSLPQTRKSAEQPKISASATAVPCLKAFPAEARARMTICSPDPVQPTFSDPKPWARPDPDRWVRATWTNGSGALQVTSSVTSTAAPRETSLAGDWTWTSRNSPPEENATAGPDGANNANEAPARMATTAAVASLARNLVLIGLLPSGGTERCAGTGASGRRKDRAGQQRHGEHHHRQVPDEVEAACSDGRPACAPRSSATSGPPPSACALRWRRQQPKRRDGVSVDALRFRRCCPVYTLRAHRTQSPNCGSWVGVPGAWDSCDSGGVDTRVPRRRWSRRFARRSSATTR